MKRREVKSKGEKERDTLLNAEFQRIARRHKKAFLSDFGAKENKICHCFHCFPICHEVMGPDDLSVLNVEF